MSQIELAFDRFSQFLLAHLHRGKEDIHNFICFRVDAKVEGVDGSTF